MAARHGTRRCYTDGCRCDDCKDAHRLYQQRYRQRRATGLVRPPAADECQAAAGVSELSGPGRVEVGVLAEIGAAGALRPGLAAVALELARVMDSRAVSQHAAAAKVLARLLDEWHKASARTRRGNLSLVKSMTPRSPSA